MPAEDPFKKKIYSLLTGNPPVGIDFTKPTTKDVILDANIYEWKFEKVGDAYHLRIGEYDYTGVVDDKVVVSKNPDDNVLWKLTFSERQIAYVITRADNPSVGWTIIPGTHNVHIKHIVATKSIPPIYLHNQLFRLEPGLY